MRFFDSFSKIWIFVTKVVWMSGLHPVPVKDLHSMNSKYPGDRGNQKNGISRGITDEE